MGFTVRMDEFIQKESPEMEFYRMTSAQDGFFDPAFRLYQESFPVHEQRTRERQESLMAEPQYHFEILLRQGALCGIILYWTLEKAVYIEHFAISPEQRGNAVGSNALKRFCEQHKRVILEIDPPRDEISVRRKGFYERLGFKVNGYPHRHPAYRRDYPPHELVVMSYPLELDEGEYDGFYQGLKHQVMADC